MNQQKLLTIVNNDFIQKRRLMQGGKTHILTILYDQNTVHLLEFKTESRIEFEKEKGDSSQIVYYSGNIQVEI